MNVINRNWRKLSQLIQQKIDTSSLQFCLSFGIAIIFTLGLSGFALWSSWEINQFLIHIYQQPNISDAYTHLSLIMQRLRMMSVVAIAMTTVIATLLIKKLLLPLQQVNHWAVDVGGFKSHHLNFYQIPSEVKTLALSWKDLLTQTQELKQRQQQYTNDLAHELRTPLSMVYAYLQKQRRDQLTDAQREALEMAISEAERMSYILQNLLDIARASQSMMPLKSESLILNDVLVDIAQMTEKFQHRVIHLEVAPFPVIVNAERDQLMQVLNHLIENAVKYSNADELVTLKLTQVDNWAIIAVSDLGDGIPLSEQSRIFEPLYRTDLSRTRSTGGAGLGLSIVKHLVENMGGKVAIQSQPGYGSTFIVKLPTLGVKI